MRLTVLYESDEEMRGLEKLAAQGDLEAQERLKAARRRRRFPIQYGSDRVKELRGRPRFMMGTGWYDWVAGYTGMEIPDFATFRARATMPAHPVPDGVWSGHRINIVCSRVWNPRALSNSEVYGRDGVIVGELIFDDSGVFYDFSLSNYVVSVEWRNLLGALRNQRFDDHLGEWERFFNLVVSSNICSRVGRTRSSENSP